MAQGFVVLAAARAASAGASLEEAVARAEQVIPLSRLIGVLDTLDYVVTVRGHGLRLNNPI